MIDLPYIGPTPIETIGLVTAIACVVITWLLWFGRHILRRLQQYIKDKNGRRSKAATPTKGEKVSGDDPGIDQLGLTSEVLQNSRTGLRESTLASLLDDDNQRRDSNNYGSTIDDNIRVLERQLENDIKAAHCTINDENDDENGRKGCVIS